MQKQETPFDAISLLEDLSSRSTSMTMTQNTLHALKQNIYSILRQAEAIHGMKLNVDVKFTHTINSIEIDINALDPESDRNLNTLQTMHRLMS